MTRDQMLAHPRASKAIARGAAAYGHHPFGCVLVGPDDRVLMRQGNLDAVRHAETELARRAAAPHEPEFLWQCTLVSTLEPCAMCAGTKYWAGIVNLIDRQIDRSNFLSESNVGAIENRPNEAFHVNRSCRVSDRDGLS
jgi:tRNA(Arg) A34 adenosine deaminase TadA